MILAVHQLLLLSIIISLFFFIQLAAAGKDVTKDVQRRFPWAPRNAIFLKTDRQSPFVASFFFRDFVYLPEFFVKNLGDDRISAQVSHEIGHCGRGDLVSACLMFALLLQGVLIVTGSLIIQVQTSGLGWLPSHRIPANTDIAWVFGIPDQLMRVEFYRYMIAAGLVPVISLASVLTLIRNREYIADFVASQREKTKILKFLRLGEKMDAMSMKKRRISLPNFHPSFSKRVRFMTRFSSTSDYWHLAYGIIFAICVPLILFGQIYQFSLQRSSAVFLNSYYTINLYFIGIFICTTLYMQLHSLRYLKIQDIYIGIVLVITYWIAGVISYLYLILRVIPQALSLPDLVAYLEGQDAGVDYVLRGNESLERFSEKLFLAPFDARSINEHIHFGSAFTHEYPDLLWLHIQYGSTLMTLWIAGLFLLGLLFNRVNLPGAFLLSSLVSLMAIWGTNSLV